MCSGQVIAAHNSILYGCTSECNVFCPHMKNGTGQSRYTYVLTHILKQLSEGAWTYLKNKRSTEHTHISHTFSTRFRQGGEAEIAVVVNYLLLLFRFPKVQLQCRTLNPSASQFCCLKMVFRPLDAHRIEVIITFSSVFRGVALASCVWQMSLWQPVNIFVGICAGQKGAD